MGSSTRAIALGEMHKYISLNKNRFFRCPYDNQVLLHSKWKWVCLDCHASVGCHPGTKMPLGTAARQPLKNLRIDAHNSFDRLWVWRKNTSRGKKYAWLSRELAIPLIETHIAFFNEEQCKKTIEICDKFYREVLGETTNALHNIDDDEPDYLFTF